MNNSSNFFDMENIEYSKLFIETVQNAFHTNTFVGFGNPESKILLIGKEPSKSPREEDQAKIYEKTILNNAKDWLYNINNSDIAIPDCKDDLNISLFNPLIPFKGMMLCQQKVGHTWRKYQKLHDYLFNASSEYYNFHEDFFISELNDKPSNTSKDANKESIPSRISFIKHSAYFQNFKIVILACGPYLNTTLVEEMFGVTFVEQKGIARQRYKIFRNVDSNKLVIHTRQLSMDASNALLAGIAEEIF